MPDKPYFSRQQPCKDCPYRCDAPLQQWDKSQFQRLLEVENDDMGNTYLCHRNDGAACAGWLLDQHRRHLPSISLRMKLAAHRVPHSWLEGLSSPVPLYQSVQAMVEANYPGLSIGRAYPKRCPGCRRFQRSSCYRVDPAQHDRRAFLCLECEADAGHATPLNDFLSANHHEHE
jgi:hypothetical protein